MVGSPVLMEMLLADGSGNIAREATTQIVFSLAIHGDLSGVDVLDIGLAGLGTIPSVLLQSTFDYTQKSGLETTFGIGTKFEKSISSTLIDVGVGSLNGTLARQMNKAKVDEIVRLLLERCN